MPTRVSHRQWSACSRLALSLVASAVASPTLCIYATRGFPSTANRGITDPTIRSGVTPFIVEVAVAASRLRADIATASPAADLPIYYP